MHGVEIVNEAALADALKQGEIAGAATDVLTVEPPKGEGNVLLEARLPNLIITPHSAWAVSMHVNAWCSSWWKMLRAFQAGQPIRRVN